MSVYTTISLNHDCCIGKSFRYSSFYL